MNVFLLTLFIRVIDAYENILNTTITLFQFDKYFSCVYSKDSMQGGESKERSRKPKKDFNEDKICFGIFSLSICVFTTLTCEQSSKRARAELSTTFPQYIFDVDIHVYTTCSIFTFTSDEDMCVCGVRAST